MLKTGKLALAGLAASLALGGGVTGLVTTASSSVKPDFTVATSPGSLTVQLGKSGSVTVTVGATGGFSGTVALSATGAPSGVSTSLTPASVTLGSASSATSTLGVAVARTTAPGSYALTVTGTSGSGKTAVSHSATVSLTVQQQAGSLAVTATPDPLTVTPGSAGTYDLALTRSGGASGVLVTFSLSGALPAGTTAAFADPSGTTGSTSALRLTTSSGTPGGSYPLTVTGSGGGYTASTAVTFVVQSVTGKAFTLAVPALAPLSPGASRPLDLLLSNPNSADLLVTNISVAVNQPLDAACTGANFEVAQIPSGYPITLPAGASAVALSALGLPSSQWPVLTMKDLSTNQDACKSASIALALSGSAQSR